MYERLAVALSATILTVGCSSSPVAEVETPSFDTSIETVVDALNNPSSVSFDAAGRLTICDAGPGRDHGNGRVILWRDGVAEDFITGFPTQYWKPAKDGARDRFKLGPLSAIWTNEGTLVVSNSGLADGVDHLLIFDESGTAADGRASNGIPPTTNDAKDIGEGNFAGLSLSADGQHVYACGQGADARSWLLRYEIATGELATFASADENGIVTNSPMQCVAWGTDSVLVVYSGAGGVDDGMLVRWNLASKKPTGQWSLPGLADPMGMARIPGTDALMIVDNNWSLTEVNNGRLAYVSMRGSDGEATVTIVRDDLDGPTSCHFGPDGRLYIALLGPEFDADKGSVIAIDGLR